MLNDRRPLDVGDEILILGGWEPVVRITSDGIREPLYWTDRYGALTAREVGHVRRQERRAEPYRGPLVFGRRRGWWWTPRSGAQRWTLFGWWARVRTWSSWR